jgi:hypothetical protein
MARIFTAGNEYGDWMSDGFVNYRGTLNQSRNQRFSPQAPNGAKGLWSLYLTIDQGVEFDTTTVVPGGIDEFYVRFHVHMGNRSDGTYERLRLSTIGGDTLLRYASVDNGNGGTPGGLFYNAFYNSAGAQFVSNSNFSHANNEWHLMEFYVKFSGSDGRLKVWFNEVLEMDWTGSLVGPSAETQCGLFRPHYDLIGGGGNNSTYYDNFAINDTTGPTNNGRVGPGWVIGLPPSGPGSTTECVNPTGTSVDNFKFINRPVGENETGFVAPTAVDDKDLYAITNPPSGFHGVSSIKITASGVRHGNAITKLKGLITPLAQSEIDSPTGVGMGVDLPVGGEDYVNMYFENNPNNSNEPFTIDELRDLEAGFQFIA